jgi:hypothetical protein
MCLDSASASQMLLSASIMPLPFLCQEEIGDALGRHFFVGCGGATTLDQWQSCLLILGQNRTKIASLGSGNRQTFAEQVGHCILEFSAIPQGAQFDLLHQGLGQVERCSHIRIFLASQFTVKMPAVQRAEKEDIGVS